MRNDDGIPITRSNAAEQLLTVLRLEVLFACDQDVRAGIQRQQFGRKLAEHVVRNGEHRLASEAEPFQFHRRRDHRERLARADDVGEQRVWRLQDAPYPGLLVSVQLDRPARAGQRQVVAIESADTRVVERVIVEAAEPFTAGVI